MTSGLPAHVPAYDPAEFAPPCSWRERQEALMCLPFLRGYPGMTPTTDLQTFFRHGSSLELCKTIKLLEDNVEGSLDDFGFENDFLGKTPKVQAMKESISRTSLKI